MTTVYPTHHLHWMCTTASWFHHAYHDSPVTKTKHNVLIMYHTSSGNILITTMPIQEATQYEQNSLKTVLDPYSSVACGHGERVWDSRSSSREFDAGCWSCIDVSGKLLIPCRLCPLSSNRYLMEWKRLHYKDWLWLQKMCWILPKGDKTVKECVPIPGA